MKIYCKSNQLQKNKEALIDWLEKEYPGEVERMCDSYGLNESDLTYEDVYDYVTDMQYDGYLEFIRRK